MAARSDESLGPAMRAARGMGGDLTVESTLRQGSTFTLALPRGTPASS